jgi:hypothetical protein
MQKVLVKLILFLALYFISTLKQWQCTAAGKESSFCVVHVPNLIFLSLSFTLRHYLYTNISTAGLLLLLLLLQLS